MPAKKPQIELRKPPSPAAEAFVSAASSANAQTPKRPNVQEPRSSDADKRSTVVTRSDGRELRRLTVYLNTTLAKRLAMHCAEHDRDQSDVLAEALEKHLSA